MTVEGVQRGRAAVRGNGAAQALFGMHGRSADGFALGEKCLLALRPEHLFLGAARPNRLAGVVRNLCYLGNLWQVDIETTDHGQLVCFVHPGEAIPKAGERIDVSWSPDRCFLLPIADTPTLPGS